MNQSLTQVLLQLLESNNTVEYQYIYNYNIMVYTFYVFTAVELVYYLELDRVCYVGEGPLIENSQGQTRSGS